MILHLNPIWIDLNVIPNFSKYLIYWSMGLNWLRYNFCESCFSSSTNTVHITVFGNKTFNSHQNFSFYILFSCWNAHEEFYNLLALIQQCLPLSCWSIGVRFHFGSQNWSSKNMGLSWRTSFILDGAIYFWGFWSNFWGINWVFNRIFRSLWLWVLDIFFIHYRYLHWMCYIYQN